jgi:hypothetical protein
MTNLKFDKEITALLVIDPYNDFISEGGKLWDRLKTVAEENSCVPHMLQALNAARQAELRVFYALHHWYRTGDYETWKYIAPIQKAAWLRKTFENGTWGGQIRREFEPQPGEIAAQEHWGSGGFGLSASCTPGDRTFDCILISTASFPPAVSTQATPAGFIPSIPSSSPSKILSRVFRGKFLDLLQRIPRHRRPDFSSTLVHTLLHHDWVAMQSPLLVNLATCCAISVAIPTVWPPAISACLASMVTA